MTLTLDSLLADGRRVACPNCSAVVLATRTSCSNCGQLLAAPLPASVDAIEFVVYGEPVPQGSMDAPKAGVVKSSNSAVLKPWRNKVTAAAQKAAGPRWQPWDCPVGVDVVFTMPRPRSAPKTMAIYPATKPDLDKLLRAIFDSLCPKKGFRLIAEDSRVVDVGQLTKTYPSPLHTHPGALDQPGVRIRVRRLERSVPLLEPVRRSA